jgi:peptidyl-prolyl cis-trans isomerase SurA
MMKRFLPFVIIAGILALAVSAAAQDSVVEEIVVRVNNSIITRSDVERARQQLQAELQQSGQTSQLQDHEKDLVRDLIDQQLLIQKSKDLGISADTDLIKRLDEIRKSMNLDSMEALEKVAAQQGVSYEDFKQNLRNNILTQATIGREVGSKLRITQEEERAYYQSHQKDLEHPEQVRISEILISTEQPSSASNNAPAVPDSAAQEAAAKKKAEQALQALKSGTSFEDAARKFSDGPTADQGGDLGYFRRGMLDKALEDKTFDQMKPGEMSDVIATRQGFVILKVVKHEQPGVPSFQEVENKIQEALYLQKLQPALREYLTKLREQAYIDIKPGYVDTGASANQTEPIMASASATPSSEQQSSEKKKSKKFLIF